MRAPFAPPRRSEPRKVDADAQAVETSWETESPDARISRLQRGDVLLVDRVMRDGRDGVLPDQLLPGDLRAEIARTRTHVAVRQLEPGPGERIGERVRVLVEASRDRLVDGIHPHGHVRGGHHGRMALRRIVGIRHGVRAGAVLRHPLPRAGGALRHFPLVAEQGVEVAVVPCHRGGGPCAFDAAGDRIAALAGAEAALPAEALRLDGGALGLGTDMGRVAGPVGLAEGVPAGDERDGLLVVHGHAGEGLADVATRGDRVGIAVRPFRIDVDESHLDGAERGLEVPVAAVAPVAQPLDLGAPVDVLFGLPDVLAPAGETERPESHRFQGAVAGQDHEVGPRDLPAVLPLDRPEQHACLVEVAVVGPAIERREALRAGARTAAAVAGAVGACAVPRHPDEERPVVTVVGRPPVLRRGHQLEDVLLDRIEVEAPERLGVVERLAHRIGQGGLLVQDVELQLVRPPVPVRRAAAGGVSARPVHDRASAFAHGVLLRMFSGLGSPSAAGASVGVTILRVQRLLLDIAIVSYEHFCPGDV